MLGPFGQVSPRLLDTKEKTNNAMITRKKQKSRIVTQIDIHWSIKLYSKIIG